jgi:hypothetical protein
MSPQPRQPWLRRSRRALRLLQLLLLLLLPPRQNGGSRAVGANKDRRHLTLDLLRRVRLQLLLPHRPAVARFSCAAA